MSSTPVFRHAPYDYSQDNREVFTIYADFDGTLAYDLIAYKLLCYAIEELDYHPYLGINSKTGARVPLDLGSLNDLFIAEQEKLTELGGRPSGPDVCNSVLLRMVRDGQLAGLNDDVLREVGKKIRLFPGVVDCFRDARHLVETLSDGRATLDVVILSAGLQAATTATELGAWAAGGKHTRVNERPLIRDITGQRFIQERNPKTGRLEYSGVEISFKASDKREYLAQDVLSGRTRKEMQIAIGDGSTDSSMFQQAIERNAEGKNGVAIIVCPAQAGNVAQRDKRLRMIKYRESFPEIQGVYNANWSTTIGDEDNPLYFNLQATLENMVNDRMASLHHNSRMIEPEGRAGQPATYSDSPKHEAPSYVQLHGQRVSARDLALLSTGRRTASIGSAEMKARGAEIALDNSPVVQKALRSLAQFKVRGAVAGRTARGILRGETLNRVDIEVAANDEKAIGLTGALSQLTNRPFSEIKLPETNATKSYQVDGGGIVRVTVRPNSYKASIKAMTRSDTCAMVEIIDEGSDATETFTYPLAHDLNRPFERTITRASRYGGSHDPSRSSARASSDLELGLQLG